MPKRALDNLLVLAIMGLLTERPMHPYEMGLVLRERRRDTYYRLTTGTLYSLVGALDDAGWIEQQATVQDSARPERTIFRLTATGLAEFRQRVDVSLRALSPDSSRFIVAVSYLGILSPGQAIDALGERAVHLEQSIRVHRTHLVTATGVHRVARLHMIEVEYILHQLTAELAWVRKISTEIENGTLIWPTQPQSHGDTHD